MTGTQLEAFKTALQAAIRDKVDTLTAYQIGRAIMEDECGLQDAVLGLLAASDGVPR